MTDAELRCVREWLGVSAEWLAAHLGVEDRTVLRWESGTTPIPDGVRRRIGRLAQLTTESVDALTKMLADRANPRVSVYRSDADYHAASPGAVMPASWHRMVVVRTANELPALSIVYAPSQPSTVTHVA